MYTEVLTALHDEAIFLPLTAKRQTAVTNSGVSGFKFGFMEFDLPLANLHPSSDNFTGACHSLNTTVATMASRIQELEAELALRVELAPRVHH